MTAQSHVVLTSVVAHVWFVFPLITLLCKILYRGGTPYAGPGKVGTQAVV